MDTEKICLQVIAIAEKAAEFIREEAQNFQQSAVEYKGRNDLVSYVDKEAEKLLVGELAKVLPEAGFIAEEGTGEPKEDGYNWVIDPVDGTTNFVHGVPYYSISIALMQGETVEIGVVYAVQQRECFHAIRGKGAFCNGERIRVSGKKQLSESLLVTGFPYKHLDKRKNYFDILSELLEHSHGFRRLGSAAIDLVYVACGRFEAFFEFGLNPWDVAGGAIIIEEAGGMVTDFEGGNGYLFGKAIVAATPELHGQVLDIIKAKS